MRPALAEDVAFDPDAVTAILEITRGYPYFLQEWGKHSWETAAASPITLDDVVLGTPAAIAALDASFFRVRFDRLTPAEKRYLRGMAELGAGPHNSSAIADLMQRKPSSLGPVRASLIAKGMMYLPGYGQSAFTVPLFDEFMHRAMPQWEA